jgi:hydrogenase-4 membrane subunit HyfE
MKVYKPIISFLIFTLLLALPPALLTFFDAGDYLVPHFWGIFVFISTTTLIVTFAVLLAQQKNSEIYAQAFLGATTFKILTCLIFVLVFIKKTHPPKVFFVVDFMYLYFLNTAFEVFYLLRTLRNQNSR